MWCRTIEDQIAVAGVELSALERKLRSSEARELGLHGVAYQQRLRSDIAELRAEIRELEQQAEREP